MVRFLLLIGIGVCTLILSAFLVVTFVPAPQSDTHQESSLLMEIRGGASMLLNKLPLSPNRVKERSLLGVVIENHEHARPYHEGLKDALMITEYLVEGYISRFVLLLDHDDLPRRTGPIRSLRGYFLDTLLPWTRHFVHAGGSPDALDRVQNDETIVAFNALPIEEQYFVRDESIPAPHNLFIKGHQIEELFTGVRRRETRWPPYPVSSDVASDTEATNISLQFFSALHNVTYTYNEWRKTYLRTNGSEEAEAQPRNVLILEVPIDAILEYGRLKMTVEGQGALLLFREGKVFKGSWSRGDMEQPIEFFAENGEKLAFSSGQTWMTVLPSMDRVSYQ